MTKVFESITKWLRRKRLLRNLRSKDFDKVVGAVHTILGDNKFYEGGKIVEGEDMCLMARR